MLSAAIPPGTISPRPSQILASSSSVNSAILGQGLRMADQAARLGQPILAGGYVAGLRRRHGGHHALRRSCWCCVGSCGTPRQHHDGPRLLAFDPVGGSILSIRSKNSILSVGSVGSILSIGSIGSFASAFAIGSFTSFGSIPSALSDRSIMPSRQRRVVMRGSRQRPTQLLQLAITA